MVASTLFTSFSRALHVVASRGYENSYRIASSLSREELSLLFHGRVLAVGIPGFLDQKVCRYACEKFLHQEMKEYTNAVGIHRFGIAFYEARESPAMERLYFNSAPEAIKRIRNLFAPYQPPIDLLRMAVDEEWSAGANLGMIGEKKMFVGLCRKLKEGSEILPHQDVLSRDDPNGHFKDDPIKAQFAANVYLKNSATGGELEIYDYTCSQAEYDELRGESYGVQKDLLPPPVLTISPEEGDCILFDSQKFHSVTKVKGGDRLAVSCFLAYRGWDKPLIFWS